MFAQAINQLDTILGYIERIDVVSTDKIGISLTINFKRAKKKNENFRGTQVNNVTVWKCYFLWLIRFVNSNFFLVAQENSVENQSFQHFVWDTPPLSRQNSVEFADEDGDNITLILEPKLKF